MPTRRKPPAVVYEDGPDITEGIDPASTNTTAGPGVTDEEQGFRGDRVDKAPLSTYTAPRKPG